MTTLTLQKLKDLWLRETEEEHSVVEIDSDIYSRAQEIFNAYQELLDLPPQVTCEGNNQWGEPSPLGEEQGGQNQVLEIYRQQAGKDTNRRKLLTCTYNLCPGLNGRVMFKFAIMSGDQVHDYENLHAGAEFRGLPRTYFLSFNHPIKIVKYIKGDDNTIEWEWFGEQTITNRFPIKYLWMLKTADVIPILSLKSFYNLVSVFKEISPDFEADFKIDDDKWEQSLEDFQSKWKTISDALYPQLGITDEEGRKQSRQKVAKFLFYVSLVDNISVDAKEMLEYGNHAIILYGPPETGKTYRAKQIACRMLGIPFDPDNEPKLCNDKDTFEFKDKDGTPITTGLYKVIQFHPNYTYQDFIGGIFPSVEGSQISYKLQKGIFKILCDQARDEANKNKKFILIIDEINRANLSSVFGELMYGLEYREQTIEIPLFGQFSIPKNVYIIGTMNNTDKSLIGFDLALRRRFGFIKVMPNMDVLETLFWKNRQCITHVAPSDMDVLETLLWNNIEEFKNRATALNDGLKTKLNLPEDKQIGHAYFLKIKDFVSGTDDKKIITAYDLEKLWDYHISPLLEEYLGMEFEEKAEQVKELKDKFTAQLQQQIQA